MSRTLQTALLGTLIAGTLDIISAFVFAGMSGTRPGQVMRFVASGPFGDGMSAAGTTGILLGFLTHYAIMFVMVTVFVMVAQRQPVLMRRPIVSGAIYGVLLYLVMYWVVMALRWPGVLPRVSAWAVGNALFSHVVCVGIPIALVTAWRQRNAAPV